MVSPDVNVRCGLNLICIPLGSASVSHVCTRKSVTWEDSPRCSSAIYKNVEHLFAFAKEVDGPVQLDWRQKFNGGVYFVAAFMPFPPQTATDFTARRREMKSRCFDLILIPAGNHVWRAVVTLQRRCDITCDNRYALSVVKGPRTWWRPLPACCRWPRGAFGLPDGWRR